LSSWEACMQPRFAIFALFASGVLGFSQAKNSSLTHYQFGETLLAQGDLQSAANEFREALSGDLQPRWTEVWSHINLGKIFDDTKQRDRAINEYRLAIRTHDNTRGALDEAARYLATQSIAVPASAFRAANGTIAPERIQITEAEYPPEGRAAGLEGTVLLTGVIGEDGLARDLHLAEGLGLGLDEVALQKLRQWRFTLGTYQTGLEVNIPVDFLLPSKQSRWHLVRVEFHPTEQASRPVFLSAKYPLGAGVEVSAMDEAGIVAAVGRLASATLSFEVDEHGIPVHFNVDRASLQIWGPQAIALVSEWRFTPGMKNGVPVPVLCTLELAWGQRELTARALDQLNSPTIALALAADESVTPPPVIYEAEPSYSEEALKVRREGTVSVSLVVGEDGVPRNMWVIRPLGFGLDDKAMEAVAQWRFQPTLLNGRLVPVQTTVRVDFRLPK
jgi:TonB family protein